MARCRRAHTKMIVRACICVLSHRTTYLCCVTWCREQMTWHRKYTTNINAYQTRSVTICLKWYICCLRPHTCSLSHFTINLYSKKWCRLKCVIIQFFMHAPKLWTDLDPTLLYIWISETYSKFVWKNKILVLGVCFRRHARALAAGLPLQDHVYITTNNVCRFKITFTLLPTMISFPQQRIRWNAL